MHAMLRASPLVGRTQAENQTDFRPDESHLRLGYALSPSRVPRPRSQVRINSLKLVEIWANIGGISLKQARGVHSTSVLTRKGRHRGDAAVVDAGRRNYRPRRGLLPASMCAMTPARVRPGTLHQRRR